MTGMPWWADLTLAVAALLVAAGTVLKYVRPAVVGVWRFLHGFARLVEDFRDTGGFAGIAATIRDLAVDLSHVRTLAERADHELHPNKGMSLRDSVARTEAGLVRVDEKVDAVRDQATAISQRQELLRAADESTAADLRTFLEKDYRETQQANAHLRSAVNELLAVESEERHGDDRQPPV